MTGMQRTSVIVIGIAVVVLAIVIGFLLFGSDEEPAASPSPSVAPSASSSLNAEMLDRRWTVLYVGTVPRRTPTHSWSPACRPISRS